MTEKPLSVCHACGNAYDPKRPRGAVALRDVLKQAQPGTPQRIVDVDGQSYMLLDEESFMTILREAKNATHQRIEWDAEEGDLPAKVAAAIPSGYKAGARWVELVKTEDGER